ncbi:BlaI/MecI/CopY family transcriptional regulator [Maricaulis sp.]|uniref:BlaI/MecI/CopY family transcriptional regulator n=1 Tax=Maricaulis sp. TaxID=1486257 RepID=UPI001B29946A|nr:BlaI/MecI/CopY family transcriptional regulator [Maricaulis sp.]MBO6796400.1 BlaI/MecI/CopY family transcriptional regulator [Maricaulis sp.]
MNDISPSPAELTVLKHLWAVGPQSARETHKVVAGPTGWSPSTTRTVLTRMVQKGLVTKADSHGLAVFEAKVRKVDLIGRMIREFTEDVLELRGPLPSTAFTNSDLLSDDEANDLMKLLDEERSE